MEDAYRAAIASAWGRRVVEALLQRPYRTLDELCRVIQGDPKHVVRFLKQNHGFVVTHRDVSAVDRLFALQGAFVAWLAERAVSSTPLHRIVIRAPESPERRAVRPPRSPTVGETPWAFPRGCGSLVMIDLDHKGHMVNKDGSVKLPVGMDISGPVAVIGVCGTGYQGRETTRMYRATVAYKNAADFLMMTMMADWAARGYLNGLPVFVVSNDASLANVAAICEANYGATEVRVVPDLESVSV